MVDPSDPGEPRERRAQGEGSGPERPSGAPDEAWEEAGGAGSADRSEGPEWESDREAGSRRRGRRRKERILHTRISRQLAEEIRGMAEDLRVPVSNLVRNVLEEAFDVMEEVTDDVGELLSEVIGRAERATRRMERRRSARPGPEDEPPATERTGGAEAGEPSLAEAFPDVLAWQRVVLNQPRRCARSGEELAAGSCAYLGFPVGGGAPIAISEWAFLAGTRAA